MTDYPSNLIHFTALTDNILHLVRKNSSDKEEMLELMIFYLCSKQKQCGFTSCKWKMEMSFRVPQDCWSEMRSPAGIFLAGHTCLPLSYIPNY